MRSRSLWVLPGYILLTMAALWPVVVRFGAAIPASLTPFDPPFQAFLLGWDWHALTTAPLRIFDAPIFYPEPRTLTYMDHMIGETVAASPIFATGGPLAAGYSFVFLLSFVLSAWGVYRLTRLFGASRSGAFLAGLLFAFCPYRFANLDLLNQLQTQFLPWGLFFAVRYVHRKKFRDAAALLAVMVVRVYFGWYYAYILLAGLIVVALHALLDRTPPIPRRHWVPFTASAALSLLLVAPVAWPYIVEHLSVPMFRRTLGQAALYSADVFDFFRTNASMLERRVLGLPTGAQSYWPGLVAVTLTIVGAGSVRRCRGPLARLPIFIGAAGMILSLGPILHVGGRAFMIPLPYALFYFIVPGFSSMRAPARFAVLVAVAAAVLAGVGWTRLEARLGGRVPRVIGAGLILLAAFASALYRPIPFLELPTRETMPPIYRAVTAQPANWPLLEIPVPPTEGDEDRTYALRQLFILDHGHRRLDGTSGFVTPQYKEFRRTLQSFPADSALDAAAKMGAVMLLVHYGDYDPIRAELLEGRVRASGRLDSLAREGADALYRLTPRG